MKLRVKTLPEPPHCEDGPYVFLMFFVPGLWCIVVIAATVIFVPSDYWVVSTAILLALAGAACGAPLGFLRNSLLGAKGAKWLVEAVLAILLAIAASLLPYWLLSFDREVALLFFCSELVGWIEGEVVYRALFH